MLDYAINSTLSFSNAVIKKHDRAGLITYGAHRADILAASPSVSRLGSIVEHLRRNVRSRSLLMMFTNIEFMDAARRRRLPALRLLACTHVLVVNFFSNEAIKKLVSEPINNTEELHRQAVARNATMSAPDRLSVTSINTYLNLRSAGRV